MNADQMDAEVERLRHIVAHGTDPTNDKYDDTIAENQRAVRQLQALEKKRRALRGI